MKQIKLWGTRVLIMALIGVSVYKWGIPLYKQYFVQKKTEIFIPVAKAREGQFTVSFHEIGTLDAEKSVPVISSINGKLITLVEEGKVIAAGDRIAELDTTDLERDVRNQKLDYENSLADVKRVQAELDILKEQNKTEVLASEARLEFNKSEYQRAIERRDKKKVLADEKLVARSEVDQAELEVRSKELEVKTGEMNLDLKKKEVQSKEQQKMADVSNRTFISNMKKFSLDDVERKVKNALITAPAPGMVVLTKVWDGGSGRRPIKEGDNVNPQQTICQLPDLTSMLVQVQVGESDAPKVLLGMPTLIRLEAVPKRIFHGTVKDIASLATEGDPFSGSGGAPGRKNFTITIAIKEVDPKVLKPGMTADVEFICQTVDKSVFVPIESIIEDNGKTYVYIKHSNGYQRTLVEVGTHNDNFICITKGLNKDDVVALRDPTKPIEDQESTKTAEDKDKNGKDKKEAAPIPGALEE
ncbi:MAG: efflux RND transporter periplasmic adaptor subunit [Armatimonadota bacterium]